MKIILLVVVLVVQYINGIRYRNPDQSLSSGGGSSGEIVRRNQPQEHIIIPLINTQEADYNPFVAPDIREFRRKMLHKDSDLDFQEMMSRLS
jgi:hypothetical protein